MSIDGNTRIHLYTHSPEAEMAIESGEMAISTGGVRRPDGTMMDMAKPLSFTLEELREMVNDDTGLGETDKRVKQLGEELNLSQEGIKELTRIGWLNNAAIGQVYSMNYVGFQRMLSGLEYISENMKEFRKYVEQRDFNELKEKMDKYISYLESDEQKLGIDGFEVTGKNVDEHISEIGAFIRRMYEGLRDGSEDGFLACIIINALIVPFAEVLKKYAILFFYENGVKAGGCDRWARLISEIANDYRFHDKMQYYILLETNMPYRDKIIVARRCANRIKMVPNLIMFDAEHALFHSKKEYLSKNKTIERLIATPENIPDDGRIYL